MTDITSDTKTTRFEVDNAQLPSGSFTEFDLPEPVLRGLTDLGYTGPTPVQRITFEQVLGGGDLIVQAKTGSGKTAAFGIPMAARLKEHDGDHVRGLVLCPTRELARQVAREIGGITKHAGLRQVCIYGGAAFGPQLDALNAGIDIVVGTPGRMLDHIRRGTLKIGKVEMMVLDEADEMLSMGFWDEVTTVLDRLRGPHQTLLFSATLPFAIQRAAAKYLREPERIELTGDELTVSGIANAVYRADDKLPKPRNLLYVIEAEKPDSALIFCNRRGETELVYNVLRRFGYRVGMINSDLSQREREKVMGQFKAGKVPFMVATDVAARGIDISELSHVFNYDLPEHIEVYLHRAGRTGRIGKRGTAVSLIRGLSTQRLREIERTYDVSFEERTLPSTESIVEIQTDRIMSTLFADAENVEVSQYQAIAKELLGRDDGPEAVAFLLRSYFSDLRQPPGQRIDGGRLKHAPVPVTIDIDAGTEAGLEADALRRQLAEFAGIESDAILEVVLETNSTRIEVESDAARRLLDRKDPLTVGDDVKLTLHANNPPRAERSDRGRGGGGRGGPRSGGGGGRGGPRRGGPRRGGR